MKLWSFETTGGFGNSTSMNASISRRQRRDVGISILGRIRLAALEHVHDLLRFRHQFAESLDLRRAKLHGAQCRGGIPRLQPAQSVIQHRAARAADGCPRNTD